MRGQRGGTCTHWGKHTRSWSHTGTGTVMASSLLSLPAPSGHPRLQTPGLLEGNTSCCGRMACSWLLPVTLMAELWPSRLQVWRGGSWRTEGAKKVERAGVGGRQCQEDMMEEQLMSSSEAGRACPPLEGSASICEPHLGPVHKSRWERLRVLKSLTDSNHLVLVFVLSA